MSTPHNRSVFTNSCLSTPRRALSRSLPELYYDEDINDDKALMSEDPLQLSLTPSTLRVHAITPPQKKEYDSSRVDRNEQSGNTSERREYAALFSTLLESNALLFEEIKALRGQQHESLTEQEKLCHTSPPQLLRDSWVTPSHKGLYQEGNESNNASKVVELTDSVEVSFDSAASSSITSSNPFASPGALAVQTMWDNFSIDELSDNEVKESPAKGKKEWTPKITVPQPFSMTTREANTPKQKSRSLKIAEEEQLRKAAQEEAELMRKFRASPVPASTFLPLYELVNAKNEHRREEVKKLSKDLLKINERPFSFTKREKELKHIKARQAVLLKHIEKKEQKKNVFKAKPTPHHLFNPLINEHIREREEYRKIRIQMRSERLLASSKLPGTMHLRGQYKRTKSQETEQDKDNPLTVVGTVLDYDQAYLEFQKKLSANKRHKQATTSELCIEYIPSQKQRDIYREDSQASPKSRRPNVAFAPHAKVSRKSPKYTHSKTAPFTYPAQMTQTALLRQSLVKDKALKNELKEQNQLAEKRRREKEIKRSVVEMSLSCDPSALLEEKKKKKLQEFQKLDKERQEHYLHQLNEMHERVRSRPLLVEQVSQLSAKQSAEAKYRATLKKAGLSDKEIQALELEHN